LEEVEATRNARPGMFLGPRAARAERAKLTQAETLMHEETDTTGKTAKPA